MCKKEKEKETFARKFVQNIPKEKGNYLAILQTTDHIHAKSNFHSVISVQNLYEYVKRHKKNKLICLSYYVSNDLIDLSFLKIVNHTKHIYDIEYSILCNLIDKNYSINTVPSLNLGNDNLLCKQCNFLPSETMQLARHLKMCKSYTYSLFGIDIPKTVKQTVQYCDNMIGYTRSNDELRAILPEEEKCKLLRSFNKVNDVLEVQWRYENLRNVIIKNKSMYSNCQVFCHRKQQFICLPTKLVMKRVVLDALDALDFFAYDTKDAEILEKNNKFDERVREEKNLQKQMRESLLCLNRLYEQNLK